MPPVRLPYLIALVLSLTGWGVYEYQTYLPSRYDLRNVDGRQLVHTRRDDQIGGGPCWAFAALTAAESNILVQGLWDGEPNDLNLSEQWLRLRESNAYGAKYTGDPATTVPGFLRGINDGGHWDIAMAHMASGRGPVAEADLPYIWFDDATAYPVPEQRPASVEWMLQSCREYIGTKAVKRAVLEAGAAHVWMTHRKGCFLPAADLQALGTYYDDGELEGKGPGLLHAVTIIGWDDQQVTQASEPGAWLVQHSQPDPPETALAQQQAPSVFWIGYGSFGFIVPRAVVYTFAPRPSGLRSLWHNAGPPQNRRLLPSDAAPDWAAAVFQPDSDERRVHSLAFMATSGEQERAYDIALYVPASDLFTSAAPRFRRKGRTVGAGLHRIVLEEPLNLPADTSIALILQHEGGVAMAHPHLGSPFIPPAVERIDAGQCYYRDRGGHWRDLAAWEDAKTPGFSLAWCMGVDLVPASEESE